MTSWRNTRERPTAIFEIWASALIADLVTPMRWWRATPHTDTTMPSASSTLPELSVERNGTTLACTQAPTRARIGRYRCARTQARLPPGTFELDIFDTVLTRKTIRGSIVGTRMDLAQCLQFAGDGKVKVHYTVEPLKNINSIFDRMRDNKIDGRVVLKI